ncbi:hypothetical protein FQA39_LY04871 [Lamprigera yunnana]|nr:hypothetical protein FQA39_LY04871 [Lamprigera yunnana]
MLFEFTLFVVFFAYSVYSQLPPGYVCVPAGTCPTDTHGIDIRIVTPGGINPCPPGQVPCLLTAPASICGRRNVSNISPFDGFATQGAWPWQAYLINQTGYAGSGALITANSVLTAAHKVIGNRATPNMIGVYMGVYSPSQLGTRLSVSAVTIHPNFNINTLFNDIAILTLTTAIAPLPQTLINTVCLPSAGQSFVGQICTVSGWGQTTFTVNDAPILQQKQVNVTIVNYSTCYSSMSSPTLLSSNVNTYLDPVGELCAGGEAFRDACTQDGGAPLVCYANNVYVVTGLVIWGKGCGQSGVYGVSVNMLLQIILWLCLNYVGAQLPQGYICVPNGSCASDTETPHIDARIMTTGNPCPPGQIPCKYFSSSSTTSVPYTNVCGQRLIPDVSPFDGFATQGAWPWQAYLMNVTGFAGSGALITPNVVITAAHRVYGVRANPSWLFVYMGVYDPKQLGTRLSVSRVFVHPQFNPRTLLNDIALLTLSSPIPNLPHTLINTVCLPPPSFNFVGRTCSVSGWGQTDFSSNDAPALQQKQVNVTVVSYARCYASMSNPLVLGTNAKFYLDPVGEICAGGEPSRDACTQDGGSPLVCYLNGRFVLAGLVIWGVGCGDSGVYGVYINIPYYINWITATIGNHF